MEFQENLKGTRRGLRVEWGKLNVTGKEGEDPSFRKET